MPTASSRTKGEEDVKTEDEQIAPKTSNAGFAFVWMLSKKDAEKAIEGCNGAVLRAGMAEAMISNKQKRKKQRREEKKNLTKVKVEEDEGFGGETLGKETERTIAVDWAFSKERWRAEMAERDQDGDAIMEEPDQSDDNEDSSGEDEEINDEDASHDSGDEDSDEQPDQPQLPAPESGTTVFVRNVPFTATEDELRTL